MLRRIQLLQTTLQNLLSARLAALKAPQQLRVRVARRWLQASLDTAYDEYLRLQMLEGAAGVPVDTWWKKGPRGFKDAQARFEADDVEPSWFEKGNTGTYAMLKRLTESKIRSYGVSVSFGDIINNALMGIPYKSHKKISTTRAPYEAGALLSQGIRDGRESPHSVTKGKLAPWLAKKVQTEVRKYETNLPETDEGAIRPIKDTSGVSDGGTLLIQILLDKNDPLGKKIRAFMRTTWPDKPKRTQDFMNRWLDIVEQTGTFPSLLKVGDSLGMGGANFSGLFFRPSWRKFVGDLWKNKRLLNELALVYEAEGVPWFQQKPTPKEIEELLKGQRPRTANTNLWLQFFHTL